MNTTRALSGEIKKLIDPFASFELGMIKLQGTANDFTSQTGEKFRELFKILTEGHGQSSDNAFNIISKAITSASGNMDLLTGKTMKYQKLLETTGMSIDNLDKGLKVLEGDDRMLYGLFRGVNNERMFRQQLGQMGNVVASGESAGFSKDVIIALLSAFGAKGIDSSILKGYFDEKANNRVSTNTKKFNSILEKNNISIKGSLSDLEKNMEGYNILYNSINSSTQSGMDAFSNTILNKLNGAVEELTTIIGKDMVVAFSGVVGKLNDYSGLLLVGIMGFGKVVKSVGVIIASLGSIGLLATAIGGFVAIAGKISWDALFGKIEKKKTDYTKDYTPFNYTKEDVTEVKDHLSEVLGIGKDKISLRKIMDLKTINPFLDRDLDKTSSNIENLSDEDKDILRNKLTEKANNENKIITKESKNLISGEKDNKNASLNSNIKPESVVTGGRPVQTINLNVEKVVGIENVVSENMVKIKEMIAKQISLIMDRELGKASISIGY